MTLTNTTTTKKIAAVIGSCAILLGAAACTKTIDGTASAVKAPATTSSDKPTETSEKPTETTEKPTDTSKNSSESSSSTDENTPAQAPDQPYEYNNGTSVKLDAAQPTDEKLDLIGDEQGRVLPFHIDNKSDAMIDLSDVGFDATITCDGNDEYIFYDAPLGGPEQLPGGQTGDYTLYFGLEKADIGKTCTIVIPFNVDGYSSVDEATFEMVLN